MWAGKKKACGAGRLSTKTLVGVAAEEAGHAVGRIRLATLTDASDVSLLPFVEETVEPGSVVHTDGGGRVPGPAREGLSARGCQHPAEPKTGA